MSTVRGFLRDLVGARDAGTGFAPATTPQTIDRPSTPAASSTTGSQERDVAAPLATKQRRSATPTTTPDGGGERAFGAVLLNSKPFRRKLDAAAFRAAAISHHHHPDEAAVAKRPPTRGEAGTTTTGGTTSLPPPFPPHQNNSPTKASDRPAGGASSTAVVTVPSVSFAAAPDPDALARRFIILFRLAADQSDTELARRVFHVAHELNTDGINLRWVFHVDERPATSSAVVATSAVAAAMTAATSSPQRGGGGGRSHHHSRSADSSAPTSPRRNAVPAWCTLEDYAIAATAAASVSSSPSAASGLRISLEGLDRPPVKRVAPLNSPRSVLVTLSNGICATDLQPIDEEDVRNGLSVQGVAPAAQDLRLAFLRSRQDALLKSLRAQRDEMGRYVSRDVAVSYLDVLRSSGCDLCNAPLLAPREDSSRPASRNDDAPLQVQIRLDDHVEDAVANARAKTNRDTERVLKRVNDTIAKANRRLAVHDEEERRKLQRAVLHEERRLERVALRKEESELRNLIREVRMDRQQEQRKAQEEAQQDAVRVREARAAESDARLVSLVETRAESRQKMQRQRSDTRQGRRELAREASIRFEREAEDRAEAAARFYEEKQRERQLAAEEAAAQRLALAAALQQRREEIHLRGAALEAERREELQRKQQAVEARLEAQEKDKEVFNELHKLREIRKAMERDEKREQVLAVEERRLKELDEERVAKSQRHERFIHDRHHQEVLVQEREQERRMARSTVVAQRNASMAFDRFAIASHQAVKNDAAERIVEARDRLVDVAKVERRRLSLTRREELDKCNAAQIQAERAMTLAIANATHPSPSPMLRRQAEASMMARYNTPSPSMRMRPPGLPMATSFSAQRSPRRGDDDATAALLVPRPLTAVEPTPAGFASTGKPRC